jgi:hypothetical protein
MDFDIIPYMNVGPIVFGLTRAEIRRRLDGPVRTFMKTAASVAATDDFEDFDIHVHYDARDSCESAEFAKGHAMRHADPIFRGQHLIGRPLLEIQRWLSAIDPELRAIDSAIISFSFGFGISAPSDDPRSPIRDVIVFRKGYYDRDSATFARV